MSLRVAHIDTGEDIQEGGKLPLHKDPKYLADLKKSFIAFHNAKIRKQKSSRANRSLITKSVAR